MSKEEIIEVEYVDNPHWRWFGDKPNIKTTTAIEVRKNGNKLWK